MSGTRKRRGTTLVELSLVIAILAMIALPFAAFVSQNLKNTVQSSTQLKEQMVLEQVMQDMEKHLRSAIRVKSDGTSCPPITFSPGGISFTSSDPQKVVSTRPVQTQYTYVLASGLLTKTVGTNAGVTFPDGLETNMITSLTFPEWSSDLIPLKIQNLGTTAPCYITIRMEAYNPTLQTTTALQKTIYLRNYTSTAVNLGTAGDYVILAKTKIVNGPTPTSVITGDIGVNTKTAIAGFSLTMDASNVFSTSPQITGKAYAADYASPTPSNLTTAISDMLAAYTDAAGRVADVTELGTGKIGGLTIEPGVYKWSTGVSIKSDVTLNGGPNDVFIFQIATGITQDTGTKIILSGGVQAQNIFWQAATTVAIGKNAHFAGIILGKTKIVLETGASVKGRLLAQTDVTLDKNVVEAP